MTELEEMKLGEAMLKRARKEGHMKRLPVNKPCGGGKGHGAPTKYEIDILVGLIKHGPTIKGAALAQISGVKINSLYGPTARLVSRGFATSTQVKGRRFEIEITAAGREFMEGFSNE